MHTRASCALLRLLDFLSGAIYQPMSPHSVVVISSVAALAALMVGCSPVGGSAINMAGGNTSASKAGGGSVATGGRTTGTTGGVGTGTTTGSTISLNPGEIVPRPDGGTSLISEADGGNCGVTTGNLTKIPGDILLVLDRSSSMQSAMDSATTCSATATNCKQRWATMISGLKTVFASPAGTSVNWGLKLFSSGTQCSVTAAMEVPISAGGAATIQQQIVQVTLVTSTPSRAAIDAGVAYLKTLSGHESKNILLATDGEPNCSGGSTNSSDVPGTVTAITAAATAGFKVYVLGVGPETGNLDNFASAGQTGHYYPALSPQDLDAALAAIVGEVASCTFTLASAPPVPDNVVVEFDGDKNLRAPRDTSQTNGWDYTSATTVELFGSWCDNVKNGTYKVAKILMGCPDQPIP